MGLSNITESGVVTQTSTTPSLSDTVYTVGMNSRVKATAYYVVISIHEKIVQINTVCMYVEIFTTGKFLPISPTTCSHW